MNNIDKHISDLLYLHDCVIVPGLGGFVANYAPASIHPVQHTFIPPSKKIAFNKNLQNNDGLLANHITLTDKKTFHEANALISTFAEQCKKLLKSGKRVEIKEVGTLFSDVEQNLQFEPAKDVNYLLNSFGLTGFQSPAIKRDNFQKKIEKQFKDRPAIPLEIKKAGVKKYWTVFAALPLAFLMLVAPLSSEILNGISIDYTNLNPFSSNAKAEYQVRESSPSVSPAGVAEANTVNLFDVPDTVSTIKMNLLEETDPEYSGIPGITVKLHETVSVPETATVAETNEVKVPETKKTVQKNKKKGRFHIIGGCFQFPEYAEKFISELKAKGYNASVVDQNKGLSRVSYDSFETREEAVQALATIKAGHNSNAWLLTK